jgi:glycine cleavage system regulatory protein
MSSNLILTIIGPDRPGLVESLATTIAAHGGNWLESRMGHLGGQFAGILRVQAPEKSVEPMTRDLRKLESIQVSVLSDHDAPSEVSDSAKKTLNLEVIGHDRPGIVSEISGVLAGFKVNVEELETERLSAPMSGEMMFQARARIALPRSCEEGEVRAELEHIASDLMVELRLEQE